MYLLCRIWRVLKQSYSGFVLCIAFEFQRRKSSLCRVSVFHYFRYWKKPFFLDIFTLIGDILKNLWPLFMDVVQLFRGYAEPLWGDTLLFTTHFSGVSGTHLMDLGRMIGGIFSWKNKTLWPLIWMGFISLKTTESLWGNSLLFTSQFSGVPGTHLIKEGLKVELILEPPNGFELGTPGLGVQCLNH